MGGISCLRSLDFIKQVNIPQFRKGDYSPVLEHKGQRLGPILIKDKNRSLIEEDIELIQKSFVLEIKGSDGRIRGICWK